VTLSLVKSQSMCAFHFKVLSIIIPRSLVSDFESIDLVLYSYLTSKINKVLILKYKKFVLS
jgi:hypothetical protein